MDICDTMTCHGRTIFIIEECRRHHFWSRGGTGYLPKSYPIRSQRYRASIVKETVELDVWWEFVRRGTKSAAPPPKRDVTKEKKKDSGVLVATQEATTTATATRRKARQTALTTAVGTKTTAGLAHEGGVNASTPVILFEVGEGRSWSCTSHKKQKQKEFRRIRAERIMGYHKKQSAAASTARSEKKDSNLDRTISLSSPTPNSSQKDNGFSKRWTHVYTTGWQHFSESCGKLMSRPS